MLRRLFLHFSVYSLGNLLVAMASLISFPIFTRIFSTSDYGVLSLVSATLLLLTGVGKAGSQHSIVRFYSEVKAGKRSFDTRTYYSTVLTGMVLTGAVTTVLWALVSQILPTSLFGEPRLHILFLLTAPLILVRVVESGLSNILRAQEKSLTLVIFAVVKKYGSIALIIVTVLFWLRSPIGFFAATLASETILVAVYAYAVWGALGPTPRLFERPFFREMLAFGLPMLGYEIAGIVLSLGDRYVIEALMGSSAVGVYSATYNLCDYVQSTLIVSVASAIQPIYNRLWEEQGRQATEAFLGRALHYYVVLSAPIIAGLTAVGPELLPLLASSKYKEGSTIIPYVMAGMVMDGAMVIFTAGLYIHKRTRVVWGLISLCAVVNLLLNVVLIPRMGLTGAALATLLAYGLLLLLGSFASRGYLEIPIPFSSLVKGGVAAGLMYLAVRSLSLSLRPGFLALGIQIAFGALVYGVLIVAIDRKSREGLVSLLGTLRARLRPASA
jgi:O-antigen/teichoic acid export membrane protein